VDYWKVPAKGATDERANASEYEGATPAGQSAVTVAGTHGGSDASANRGSGCDVGRVGKRCPGARSSLRIPRMTCVTTCSRMVTSLPRANQSCMTGYLTGDR
jgi:hypothetical protein